MATRMIAYLRVSTTEQATNGHGLDAQRAAIEGEAARRGWEIQWITDAGVSGKTLDRPGMQRALAMLGKPRRHRAVEGLVVAKLDRLSRSLLDFAGLMQRSQREGWQLCALDLGVDTSTSSGELMAGVLATFAQFERRLIAQRTRAGLAVLKARGVRLGNPGLVAGRAPAAVRDRILEARRQGASYAAIAARLNTDGVPTSFGARHWWPASVRAVERRVA